MEITVNERTLKSLLNDKKSNLEIIDFLNKIIDNEIEKENPDCDLIDECINAIDNIQNENNFEPTIKLVLTKKQVLKYCKRHSKNNNALKSIIAACIVLAISGTTVLNTSPALAENVKSFFETIVSTLQDISAETETENNNISSIYATYNSKLSKVKSSNDIDSSKITITAIYDDGSKKEIPISKCEVRKSLERTNKGNFILVAISYNGCACSIAFEMEG